MEASFGSLIPSSTGALYHLSVYLGSAAFQAQRCNRAHKVPQLNISTMLTQ